MRKNIVLKIIISLVFLTTILSKNEFAVSEFILGDINGDAIVDLNDMKLISKHILESKNDKQNDGKLTGEKLNSADINRNGEVNYGDVMAMLKYLVTKKNPYNIGSKYSIEETQPETKQQNTENSLAQEKKIDSVDLNQSVKTNILSASEIKKGIQNQEIGKDQVALNVMEEKLLSSNSIRFEKQQIEIKTNEVEKVKVITENNTDLIKITTSNSNIAEVYGDGIVVGKSVGEAVLTAEQGNQKTQCKIKVNDRNEATYKIEIDKPELEIETSESSKLEARTEPANKEVKWESNNSEIVEVKQDGTIIGKKAGKATITVISGDKIATSVVTVKDKVIEIEEVAINKSEIELSQGEETSIMVGIAPKDATIREIELLQENDNIIIENNKIETNQEGIAEVKIYANKPGTTTIIAKAGEKETKAIVKIIEPEAEKIILDTSEIIMEEDQLRRITAKIEPEIAKNNKITWKSSNTQVVEVDENGLVKSNNSGEATITATVDSKSAICKVKVEKAKISVKGIKLSSRSISLKEDAEEKLIVELEPTNASNKEINVKLSNDNASIESERVTAGNNGIAEIKIKGKKVGTSTLTVSSGTIVENCNITITPKDIEVNKITLGNSSLSINKGKTKKLTIKIEPTNATNKKITVKSNNSNINIDKTTVTAGKDGKAEITVTGKKAGRSTITVTSGKITAKCNITINAVVESLKLSETKITLVEGKTKQLKVTITPSNAVDKKVTWTSNNKNVATVDSNGKITGKKAGSATITAKANGKTASCIVTVRRKYNNNNLEPDTKASILGWQEYDKYYGSYYITQTAAYDGTHIIAAQNDGVTNTPREVGCNGGRLAWYNIKTGKLTNTLKIGPDGYHMARMAYDSDRNMVLVGVVGDNKLIQVNNSTKKFAANKYTYLSDGTYNLAYDSLNHQLLGFGNNIIKFYKYNKKTNKYEKTKSIKLKPSGVTGSPENFCTDGQVIYAVYRMGGSAPNGKVLVFDIKSGKLLESHKENGSKFYVYKNKTSGHVQDAIIDSEGKLWMICGQVYWKVKNY